MIYTTTTSHAINGVYQECYVVHKINHSIVDCYGSNCEWCALSRKYYNENSKILGRIYFKRYKPLKWNVNYLLPKLY